MLRSDFALLAQLVSCLPSGLIVEQDAVKEFDFNCWDGSSQIQQSSKGDFQRTVSFGADRDVKFSHKEVVLLSKGPESQKVDRIFSNNFEGHTLIAGSKAQGSVEARVTVTWGGSEGTKVETSGRAEVHNDRGRIEVEAKSSSDGRSSVRTYPVILKNRFLCLFGIFLAPFFGHVLSHCPQKGARNLLKNASVSIVKNNGIGSSAAGGANTSDSSSEKDAQNK